MSVRGVADGFPLAAGLRRGEALGLTWNDVRAGAAELHINWQLTRVSHNLLHSDTKTEGSAAVLPLPDICLTALKIRREQQDYARTEAGDAWHDLGLVFTTRWGTPVDPRNFNRSFHARCARAGVRRIRVHDTRHTCGSLLTADRRYEHRIERLRLRSRFRALPAVVAGAIPLTAPD